jgi:hypothetical protein
MWKSSLSSRSHVVGADSDGIEPVMTAVQFEGSVTTSSYRCIPSRDRRKLAFRVCELFRVRASEDAVLEAAAVVAVAAVDDPDFFPDVVGKEDAGGPELSPAEPDLVRAPRVLPLSFSMLRR